MTNRRSIGLSLALVLCLCGGARAQEKKPAEAKKAEKKPAKKELPPKVPRPEFMSRKPWIPDILIKDKKESTSFTGFPVIGWDQENGFVFGAFVQHYDNGKKTDPFFRSTPYRRRVTFGGLFTTVGLVDMVAGLDLPYFLESPYRLRLGLLARYNPSDNYYGVGDDAMKRLHYSGSPNSIRKHSDFVDEISKSLDNGQTAYTRYIEFESTSLGGGFAVERDLLGGILRPLLGLQLNHTDVNDYTGERVRADSPEWGDVRAIQTSTKLREDALAGRINGFRGGWDNRLKLGLTFDTRDFEPDPSEGVLLQVSSEISTRVLGSDFDYQRVTLSGSGYYNLIPSLTRLIVAGRVMYTMHFGAAPFFVQKVFSRNQLNANGLGGFGTLRGYKRARFIGRSMVLANLDVRWSFLEMVHEGHHLRFMLAAFVDVGRAFDAVELHFRDWKPAFGGGFRFAWNLSTIISVDVAASNEDQTFYVNFGHQF